MPLKRSRRLSRFGQSSFGQVLGDTIVGLRWHNNTLSSSRAAIVVPAKLFSLATKRNRWRRVLAGYLAVRLEQFTRTVDLVIYLRSGAKGLKSRLIIESLEQLLKKANLV